VSETVLEVTSLTIRYGGVTAVGDATFSVERGEVLGVIGPNGAGKTTTFNAIAGAVRPTSGQVHFDGQRIDQLKPSVRARLGVARTFQTIRLFKSMTVAENVLVAASSVMSSLPEARSRVAEILEKFSLSELANHQVAALPLASQKRIEIARALAIQPTILLLDEMMSGLNPAETSDLVDTVRALVKEGLTLLVVEHVLRVINELADRVVVFDHGKLIAQGVPEAVMQDELVIEAYLGRRHAKD